MNIQSLLREMSRPRPLRWSVDIVSKSRLWKHGASAVSLETQTIFQAMGGGKDGSPAYLGVSHAGVTLVLDPLVSLVYATYKFADIGQ
jgi:hypothetical protein